jgi:hypothetical protein
MGRDRVSELLPLPDIMLITLMIYDGGMILTREIRRAQRKTCPSATSFTTNSTWIDTGANPGLRGERPATNRLSHGTAGVASYLT